MGKIVNEKNIISVFLLTGLIVVAIKSHSYQYIGELITATKNEVCSENVEETTISQKPGPTEETENPGPAGTETDSEHAFPTPGV